MTDFISWAANGTQVQEMPTHGSEEWTEQERAELQEELQDAATHLARYHDYRRAHDSDGYFAELAGSTKCLALGHREPFDEDTHTEGWEGELICDATRYGDACMYCEGECDFGYGRVQLLWDAPGVSAEAAREAGR